MDDEKDAYHHDECRPIRVYFAHIFFYFTPMETIQFAVIYASTASALIACMM